MKWDLVFFVHALSLIACGFQDSLSLQTQVKDAEAPEDSEKELPSLRRTTRISRGFWPNSNNPMLALVRTRRDQFDQFGPTEDDGKIKNFWRIYARGLAGEIEEDQIESLIENEMLAQTEKEKKPEEEVVVEIKEVENQEPSEFEDQKETEKFSARRTQKEDSDKQPPLPLPPLPPKQNVPAPNVMVSPYPYPYYRPDYQDPGIHMQPVPWRPPPNYMYYSGQSAYPMPISRPLPISSYEGYPTPLIGYYVPQPAPTSISHSPGSVPPQRLSAPKHQLYTIPSPGNEMKPIPGAQMSVEGHENSANSDLLASNGKPIPPTTSGVPQPSYPMVSPSPSPQGAPYQGLSASFNLSPAPAQTQQYPPPH